MVERYTQQIQNLPPIWACEFESRLWYQNIMRSYLNIEDEQLRILLQIFVEISLARDLTRTEECLQAVLKNALDKSLTEW